MENIWFEQRSDVLFDVMSEEVMIAMLVFTKSWKLESFDCLEHLFESSELFVIADKLKKLNA